MSVARCLGNFMYYSYFEYIYCKLKKKHAAKTRTSAGTSIFVSPKHNSCQNCFVFLMSVEPRSVLQRPHTESIDRNRKPYKRRSLNTVQVFVVDWGVPIY